MHNGVKCFGKDLSDTEFLSTINLEWLADAYNNTSNKSDFFNPFYKTSISQTQHNNKSKAERVSMIFVKAAKRTKRSKN